MKRHKMLSSMELIDDKYIEEASPKKKNKSRLIRLSSIAAAVAIMITSVSVWLFTPYDKTPPDVSKHSKSQYYTLIQKLNELTFRAPNYNNRFELYSSIFDINTKEQSEMVDGSMGSSPSSLEYVETTDNQVSGVIEADLIKRSNTHIFYLRENVLSVYPINGTETECLSTFTVETGKTDLFSYSVEMFLSEDCSSLSIIMPCYMGNDHSTQVVSLDVSDPANITEKERISVSGSYVSSRLTNGQIMLITNFSVKNNPDFSDESSFIPQITTRDSIIRPAMESILCPETATKSVYAVITLLDQKTTSVLDTVACLSYSSNIYASADSLYLTRNYDIHKKEGENLESVTMASEITRVSYSDSDLEIKGSTMIKGRILNQYSLDEHEGVLRVATTTHYSVYKCEYNEQLEINSFIIHQGGQNNASLYCLDKESFEVLAAVENFAPDGESVRSARFDGDSAYICTAVQLSDPVFYFDLSDLKNITYKDTGTIEGFSTSLINFGDYLLGIGVKRSWNTVKIEVYEESDNKVVSVCDITIPNANYSDEYKSYFIDREKGLVGIMIYPTVGESYYLLLHFDGSQLVTVLEQQINDGFRSCRALFIDDCFYIFTARDFIVKKMK